MSDRRFALTPQMHIQQQFVRYATVGLASNALAYLLYLGLTTIGVGHKLAMSLIYAAGVLQTFILNKKWSFQFGGATNPALARYVTSYAFGYIVNFLGLWLLVDLAGWPHQWVQAVMIVVVAIVLFCALRYWVFTPGAKVDRP